MNTERWRLDIPLSSRDTELGSMVCETTKVAAVTATSIEAKEVCMSTG